MFHFIKQDPEKDLFIIDVNIRVSFQTNMKEMLLFCNILVIIFIDNRRESPMWA